jgi:hypothetical protein
MARKLRAMALFGGRTFVGKQDFAGVKRMLT